jgi:hypothetical protein
MSPPTKNLLNCKKMWYEGEFLCDLPSHEKKHVGERKIVIYSSSEAKLSFTGIAWTMEFKWTKAALLSSAVFGFVR